MLIVPWGVQDYAITLNTVRPIYEYNRSWDFNAYRANQHSVTTLREQMQRIGGWMQELEKMRARQQCGILEVTTCIPQAVIEGGSRVNPRISTLKW